MHSAKRTGRIVLLLLLVPTAFGLIGCGGKEEKKSNDGYYDGPMKSKGNSDGEKKDTKGTD